MQDEIVREMAWERRMMGLGQRALDSHFECDTEVCGKCLDWGFVAQAFSRR